MHKKTARRSKKPNHLRRRLSRGSDPGGGFLNTGLEKTGRPSGLASGNAERTVEAPSGTASRAATREAAAAAPETVAPPSDAPPLLLLLLADDSARDSLECDEAEEEASIGGAEECTVRPPRASLAV